MKGVLICIVVVLFIFLLPGLVNAVMSCSVITNPSSCAEALLMETSATTNAHAALPNDPQSSYNYGVCCTDPVEVLTGSCSSGTQFLLLSNNVNAHVQESTIGTYTNSVCIKAQGKTITCNYRDNSCNGAETCLLSISASDNAHAGDCNAYTRKVCCEINTAPNQPPTITSISATPYYVNYSMPVRVTSVASDPNSDQMRLFCNEEEEYRNGLNCGGSSATQNPSCTFQAPWPNSGQHTIYCYVHEVSTQEGYNSSFASDTLLSDNIVPVVSITSQSNLGNQFYGQSQPITFTATASDSGGSGLYRVNVSTGLTDSTLVIRQSCSSSPCVYTSTPTEFTGDPDDVISFRGRGEDQSGNYAFSTIGHVTICNLTSVSVANNCGANGCESGEKLTVTANYRGQCGSTAAPPPNHRNFIQLDANTSDDSCVIQRDCTGVPNCISNAINYICTPAYPNPTTCIFDWNIPASIPSSCEGKILNFSFAALYDYAGPPSGQWFDRHNTSGGFKFFGDTAPVVTVAHSPQNPSEFEFVEVNATAIDDTDVDSLNISVYSSGALVNSVKCTPAGINPEVNCSLSSIYAPGTYNYNATALDNTAHISHSTTGIFTVTAGPDTFPPLMNTILVPAEIGGLTPVDITVSASDPSGVGSIDIYFDDTGESNFALLQSCAYAPPQQNAFCAGAVSAHVGGTVVLYKSTAVDSLFNSGNDPVTGSYNYTVCNLTLASISPVCGVNGCVPGDSINVHAEYYGACPQTAYMQVDASSLDGSCNLSAVGGSMAGINATCQKTGFFTSCDATWEIPAVPSECYGKTILANYASINKNNFPPAGEWFDSVPASGSFIFDSPPAVNIYHSPPAPIISDMVDFNATATDNYNVGQIKIYVDDYVVPKVICNQPVPPETTLNCSYRGGPYPNGTTRNYTASATDGYYTIYTQIDNFTVSEGPDLVGPVVSVVHAPLLIGINTIINYTATASDARSGVNTTALFVNGIEQCFVNGSICTYSEGALSAGTGRNYSAESYDNSGNVGVDPIIGNKSLTVCSYDSVSLQAQCGTDLLCRAGESILVNGAYHGACPDPAHLQTDAADVTGTCTIQATGGDIQGIDVSCPGPSCNRPWPIPHVPLQCQGRTVTALSSSLRQSAGGEVYDFESPTGSFTFYLEGGLAFVINTVVSDTTPNYGDIIDINVSCYLFNETSGERSECDNSITSFTNITIDYVINYIEEEGWVQEENFNGSVWNIPIDTAKYNSLVNVTLRFGSPTNYIENSSAVLYSVNLPPTIENPETYPELPIVGDTVTFTADITDPEHPSEPNYIDKAFACKRQNCSEVYCEMQWNNSNQFNCSYGPIGNDYWYWIYANDTDGAENITKKLTLREFDEYINVTVQLPDIGILVPLTDTGIANYTRGMKIKTLTTAEIRNATNNDYLGPCDYTNCIADYEGQNIDWDFFYNAWKESVPTTELECNTQNDIEFTVTRTSDLLDRQKSVPVFVNCVPRVVVEPIEVRIVLGQSGMIIFNVTVYNPYSSGTNFNLTFDAGENNFVHNWLVFECVSGNCGLSEDAKTATLSIGSISSETVNVRLISPGRAGTYPIRFIAKDLSDQKSYEAKARLQIFSESLPEFEPWQLIIAVAITSLIFALIIEKKKQ